MIGVLLELVQLIVDGVRVRGLVLEGGSIDVILRAFGSVRTRLFSYGFAGVALEPLLEGLGWVGLGLWEVVLVRVALGILALGRRL